MNQTPRKYRYICINLILIFGFTWSTPGYSQSSPTISKISKTLNIEDSSEELDEGGIGLTYIHRRIIAGEIKESIEWLGQELELIEKLEGRYSESLVNPLALLGDAHFKKGDYYTALQTYQRAVHLRRVNSGLHSEKQIPIVYREAEAYAAIENIEEANNRHEYAYSLLKRLHEDQSLELINGVYRLGDWYSKINNVYAARGMYEYALKILDKHNLLESEEALPAYRGIALGYRLERFPPTYIDATAYPTANTTQFDENQNAMLSINNFPAGENALQKIIAIHQKSSGTFSFDQEINAILELADWYLLWDKTSRARVLYSHVYTRLSDIKELDATAFFSTPKLLYFPIPKSRKPPPLQKRGEQLQGQVELGFKVTKGGYVRNLKTLSANPKNPMEFRVRKSMRLARYRPALLDGAPADYPDGQHQYTFNYFETRDNQTTDQESN